MVSVRLSLYVDGREKRMGNVYKMREKKIRTTHAH